MLPLSGKWAGKLTAEPETGIGYQIASIVLKDGKRFDRVVVDGNVTRVRDVEGIPFSEDQIEQIIVTHDKWDFNDTACIHGIVARKSRTNFSFRSGDRTPDLEER